MIGVFVGFFSLVLILTGALCIYEDLLYPAEQRAQVPWLSKFYLGTLALLIVVGFVGILSTFVDVGIRMPYLGILVLVSALPSFLQNRMHKKTGVERGPLVPHLTERWL